MKKVLLTNVQMSITGDVLKKYKYKLGFGAAFLAIALGWMPCCCTVLRFCAMFGDGKSQCPTCCRDKEAATAQGTKQAPVCNSSHQCCCNHNSNPVLTPATVTFNLPCVEVALVPLVTAWSLTYSEATPNWTSDQLHAPPDRLIFLSCTNLLI